jgi:hypothetical protein
LGNWLACGLLERDGDNFVHRHDGPDLTVLLSGYLSDIVGRSWTAGGGNAATALADFYLESGAAAFGSLRGSYSGVILDHRTDTAVAFNDRQGSRPIFMAGDLEHGLYLAPESKALSRLRASWREIDHVAVGEFLVRGCCYGSATLFKSIRRFDQASVLHIGNGRVEQMTYWAPRFTGDSAAGNDELLDELDGLLSQSTARLISTLPDPVILLSGGVDSRLMLAYLSQQGVRLPSISYYVDPSSGEDHVIAQRLAALVDAPHEQFVIGIEGFVANAVTETLAADGRVQICDAPSSRWSHIGRHYSAMFIGDESFGWKGSARTVDEAFDILGWWNIDAAPRVCDWLKRDSKRAIAAGVQQTLRELTRRARSTDMNCLKDELYYSERVANLLNGFSARRLAVCEQARPLLDEDVVEFFMRVPNEMRVDKRLVRDLLDRRFPRLAAIPYSRKTSVPWDESVFRSLISSHADVKSFIEDNVTTKLCSELGALLDKPRLTAMARAYFEGRGLPPYRGDWWARIPGGWRLSRARADRVGTLRSLLRIMQLNIYLSQP